MSRSERWSNANEIRRTFHDIEDPAVGAGPILCTVKGRKYTDDGQSHIAVIGRTGKGKSQCCSLPFMHEIFRKGESLIMLDPKGEGLFVVTSNGLCYMSWTEGIRPKAHIPRR